MKRLWLLIVAGLMGLAMLTLVENVAVLFQCPGQADESWALYIIGHKISDGASFFVRYFECIADDITFVKSRVICLALRMLSGIFLGWAAYRFFKERLNLTAVDKWIMMGAIPCLFSTSQTIVNPSYVSLNCVFGCLAVGSLVLAVRSSGRVSHVWAGISGLFAIQLPFIMATNVVFVPVMLIALLVIRNRLAISFSVGCLLGVVAFFYFVCSPVECANQIMGMDLDATKTDGHDIMMLVRWLYSTAVLFMPFVAVGLLLSFVEYHHAGVRNWWKIVTFAVLFVCAGFHARTHLLMSMYIGTFVRVDICLLYLVAVALVYQQIRRGKLFSVDNLIMVLFLLAPLCLSFGTNIEFAHRGGRYMIFLLLVIWPLMRGNWSWTGTLGVLLFAVTYGVFTFQHLRLVNGYTGVRLVCSSQGLQEFGCQCVTTPEHVDLLKKLRAATEGRGVLIGGRYVWGPIVLLSKEPLKPVRFAYTPSQVPALLEAHPVDKKDIAILEQPDFMLTSEDEKSISKRLRAMRVSRAKISQNIAVVTFE